MKITALSILVFLTPYYLIAQDNNVNQSPSPVIKKNQDIEKTYYVVTPLLLRQDSSFLLNKEKSTLLYDKNYTTFLSSLIVPGTGQISNRNWIKAGLFVAVEAASIFFAIDYRNKAEAGEREYEQWANQNWSVVQYSKWLVDYHEVHGIDNPRLGELRSMVGDVEPAYDTEQDWDKVNLEVLRDVERNTPYITSDQDRTNNFSHVLPDYGSQQYYELISKYYQYQGGWRDYLAHHNTLGHTGENYNLRYLIDRNGAYASPFFFEGAELSNDFNTYFRRSGYFISALIANHILSAFDAFFTFQLKQNKLQATSSMVPGKQFSLTYSF